MLFSIYQSVRRLFRSEKGQGLVEYALILGLIAVAAVVALQAMGVSVTDMFADIVGKLGGTVPEP